MHRAMSFQFIDNTTIDRSARRLIRSHAATGKNVGKVRRPRQKMIDKSVKSCNTCLISESTDVEDAAILEACNQKVLQIERQFGDGMSVLSLPVELDSASRPLFQQALHFLQGPFSIPALSNIIDFHPNEAKQIMIRTIFLDGAYLHSIITLFIALTHSHLLAYNTSSTSLKALYHLSETLRLMNAKLSTSEALSDSAMAVVIALTQYERSRGDCEKAMVHFKGLRRMVELRGGIEGLIRERPGLALKVLSADLDFAVQLDGPICFGVEALQECGSMIWLRNIYAQNHILPGSESLRRPDCVSILDYGLQGVLSDITSLVWLLNGNAGPGIQLDSFTFDNILINIGHQLIYINPLNESLEDTSISLSERLLQLHLLAFLTAFLPVFRATAANYPLLTGKCRIILQGFSERDKGSNELLLWSLFMGRITVLGEEDESWWIPRLRSVASSLIVRTWDGASEILRRFPWVGVVHGKPGQAFWDNACGMTGMQSQGQM